MFSVRYRLTAGLVALMLFASGCKMGAVMAYKVMGPPDVPAKYQPKQQDPLLVLVEDYHRSTAFTDDELLSRYLEQELRQNLKKVPIVDSSKVRQMRLSDADGFKKMSVAEVGRQAGAAQVIWVEVTDRNIESLLGGESLRGDVAVRVKMVDVKTGDTLWPTDMAEGYPLYDKTNWGGQNAGSETELKNALYRGLSDKIAKLFYKWKPDDEAPEGFVSQ